MDKFENSLIEENIPVMQGILGNKILMMGKDGVSKEDYDEKIFHKKVFLLFKNFLNYSNIGLINNQEDSLKDFVEGIKEVIDENKEIYELYFEFNNLQMKRGGLRMTFSRYIKYKDEVACSECNKHVKDSRDEGERWLIISENICLKCIEKLEKSQLPKG